MEKTSPKVFIRFSKDEKAHNLEELHKMKWDKRNQWEINVIHSDLTPIRLQQEIICLNWVDAKLILIKFQSHSKKNYLKKM